ncbi:helix-turn-helix domain-containing protein [Actinomadura sp. 6N118]|uniref:helix-turn-helix domain-containing protein n=1 Tax=Actinomadura sp. 6N118 TaxID=3375151 RepID=UPI0037BC2A59
MSGSCNEQTVTPTPPTPKPHPTTEGTDRCPPHPPRYALRTAPAPPGRPLPGPGFLPGLKARASSGGTGERREAYVRGFQLAEIRKAAGITQAELADILGVSQARISKIEHGEVSGIDVVRDYVAALGGHHDLVATLGDRTWRVA